MSLPRPVTLLAALALLLCIAPAASASQADLLVSTPEVEGVTEVGATAVYKAAVYSYGPDTTDVTVTDTLGPAETLVSASTTQGSCTQTAPVVCTLGALPPAVVVEIRITVRFTKAMEGNEHKLTASGAADNTDPDPTYDTGAVSVRVTEPVVPVSQTPTATTGSWSRTQSTLKVDAVVSPVGSGTYYFEYGKTTAYGEKTAKRKVAGENDVEVKAVLSGLAKSTKYHYRVVLVAGGKTYRGKNRSARTFGKLLYPEVTLVATRRSASSTTYTGEVGGGFADAPGACKGKIQVDVYTSAGADLLKRTTRVDSRTCEYTITVPFGTSDARKYGKPGSVLVQARFSGNSSVAAAGSKADRP